MDYSKWRIAGWLSAVAAVFLTLCLLVANTLLSVHGTATNLGLYQDLWVKHGVPSEAGMSIDDLALAGQSLLDYFSGRLESPQLSVTIFGEERALYNDDELTHLEDVKDLFSAGLTAEWISIAAAFAATMTLLTAQKRKAASRAFYAAGGISVFILALLAIPAALDFNSWWTSFHLITFTNDLWLLNPNTDWLIRMFPEPFFLSMVERIALHAGATALILIVSGFLLGRVRHRASAS